MTTDELVQIKVCDTVAFTGVLLTFDPTGFSSDELIKLETRARNNGRPLLKQWLVECLQLQLDLCKTAASHLTMSKPVLSITMSCGNSINYKTLDDIPETDVPCPCGDKSHWFIQYKDLR